MHTAIIHPQDMFYGACNEMFPLPLFIQRDADEHVQTRFTDEHWPQTSHLTAPIHHTKLTRAEEDPKAGSLLSMSIPWCPFQETEQDRSPAKREVNTETEPRHAFQQILAVWRHKSFNTQKVWRNWFSLRTNRGREEPISVNQADCNQSTEEKIKDKSFYLQSR